MTEQALTKTTVDVRGAGMAYHSSGEGAPILLLHGNPTSSYLWRDVLPALEGCGRLIVPDLIGMGDSAKLPNPGPDTLSLQDPPRLSLGIHRGGHRRGSTGHAGGA